MNVVKVFYDEDKSGMSVDNREKFLEAIKMFDNGEIRILIVTQWDRFSRDLVDLKIYTERFLNNGGLVLAVEDALDFSAVGQLKQDIMSVMKKHEVYRIAEDTKQVMINHTKKGKSGGGVVNYGYKLDDEKYLIQEPDEAIVVVDIYNKFLQGYSYQDIIDSLDNRDIKTRKGNRFTRSTLNDILQNVKYKGVYRYNRQDRKRKKKTIVKRHFDEVWAQHGIKEAIISEEDFDKVQEIMKTRKGITNSSNYILSGVMLCGECGSKMVGSSRYGGKNKGRMKHYICPNHLKRNGGTCPNKGIDGISIEEKVIQILTDIINQFLRSSLFDSSYLEKNLNTHLRLKKSIQKSIDNLNNQIECDLEKILDPDIREIQMLAFENE